MLINIYSGGNNVYKTLIDRFTHSEKDKREIYDDVDKLIRCKSERGFFSKYLTVVVYLEDMNNYQKLVREMGYFYENDSYVLLAVSHNYIIFKEIEKLYYKAKKYIGSYPHEKIFEEHLIKEYGITQDAKKIRSCLYGNFHKADIALQALSQGVVHLGKELDDFLGGRKISQYKFLKSFLLKEKWDNVHQMLSNYRYGYKYLCKVLRKTAKRLFELTPDYLSGDFSLKNLESYKEEDYIAELYLKVLKKYSTVQIVYLIEEFSVYKNDIDFIVSVLEWREKEW